MPAISRLLRREFRYNSDRYQKYGSLFHNVVIRLLHHLIVNDSTCQGGGLPNDGCSNYLDHLAGSLSAIYATEIVSCLTSSVEIAQHNAIDIVVSLCRSITQLPKEERGPLRMFICELAARNTLPYLATITHSRGQNAAEAKEAYQELAKRTAKLDARRNLDIWQGVGSDWQLDDERKRRAKQLREAALKKSKARK